MSAHPDLIPPARVLEAFDLEPKSLARAKSGLMNPTWYACSRGGAALVLQRVNPIFSADVNIDIAAVTEHLLKKGLVTPRLVPTRDGALWLEHEGVWRALTRIDGVCHDALSRATQARAAGRIVAEFHRAVSDLEHRFRNRRLGVHDTARHLRLLREALVEHRSHRHFAVIEPLAERVLEAAAALPPLPGAGVPGLDPAAIKGEVALVNVFASWCLPCKVEHPLLMRLARENIVAVYGINYKDDENQALAWLKNLGNPYRAIGYDGSGRAGIEWGVYGVPETFVIDKAGRIRFKHVGPIEPRDLEETLLPLISRLSQ